MTKRFTGWHMTAILVGGFSIVVAVNILMATLAIGSFGGVVVENSYVASQNFNRWLEQAERENALGWNARVARSGDGRLEVVTEGTPKGAKATVELRHPLGRDETLAFPLTSAGNGRYLSQRALPEGRWLVRLTLSHGADSLRMERPVG
ncbi:FixH family protein [Parerythrobacter aestuarii]|uniref:FixH family protein n=1 Tax=Parerythrobacter aestuarii TaxID=3020909 RepID=UPI0024DEE65D|nr:FixH family protein [Parerythrobacter aestuarii]